MFVRSWSISGDVSMVTKQRFTQSTASVSDPKLMGGLNDNVVWISSGSTDSLNCYIYDIVTYIDSLEVIFTNQNIYQVILNDQLLRF